MNETEKPPNFRRLTAQVSALREALARARAALVEAKWPGPRWVTRRPSEARRTPLMELGRATIRASATASLAAGDEVVVYWNRGSGLGVATEAHLLESFRPEEEGRPSVL